MKIKICGLTQRREAQYMNKNRVDYCGFVLFYPKSKRNITIFKAQEIMEALHPDIKKAAVVVSPTVEEALAICQSGFDIIQIHGNLSEEVYDAITIDIWRAFNVKNMDEYEAVKNKDKIKGFVFDSSDPGSGIAFDHMLLDTIDRVEGKLFILAGGLNADNVKEAIDMVGPDVVDVSSGVEFVDKLGKEPGKVDEFVGAVYKF